MAVPPITPREITRAINANRVKIPLLEIPDPSRGSIGPPSTDSRRTVSNAIDLKSEIVLLSQSLAKLSMPTNRDMPTNRGSIGSMDSQRQDTVRIHHHTKTLSNPFLKSNMSSNPMLFESIDVIPCEPLSRPMALPSEQNSLLKNPIVSPTSMNVT